jgi:hypothetical protein
VVRKTPWCRTVARVCGRSGGVRRSEEVRQANWTGVGESSDLEAQADSDHVGKRRTRQR